jgi:hypothetical protein
VFHFYKSSVKAAHNSRLALNRRRPQILKIPSEMKALEVRTRPGPVITAKARALPVDCRFNPRISWLS